MVLLTRVLINTSTNVKSKSFFYFPQNSFPDVDKFYYVYLVVSNLLNVRFSTTDPTICITLNYPSLNQNFLYYPLPGITKYHMGKTIYP